MAKSNTLGVLVVGASIALAGLSETTSYSYDALGRLTKIVHSGTVNGGVLTEYTYDKADSRTRRLTTGASLMAERAVAEADRADVDDVASEDENPASEAGVAGSTSPSLVDPTAEDEQ
jgi:hypothetical protein